MPCEHAFASVDLSIQRSPTFTGRWLASSSCGGQEESAEGSNLRAHRKHGGVTVWRAAHSTTGQFQVSPHD